MTAFSVEAFQEQLAVVTNAIAGRSLNKELEQFLNSTFPAHGDVYNAIKEACHIGIEAGVICKYEGGGLRYGRVIKPTPALAGCSVDVVDMDSLAGPHHRHPQGEIDLIMPLDDTAKFDGQGAGWLVYDPDSAHAPTTSEGRALVLYLLPNGEIEFTKST